jgi:hypothetical protein
MTGAMFSETDGPTALRRDRVQALALSLAAVEVEGPQGPEKSCAGVSAVWSGQKGHVAVLIRGLEPARLRRFVYSAPLLTLEDLMGAVEEALAFIEGHGFCMDAPEFVLLDEAAQAERLTEWDNLRKLQRTPRTAAAAPPALDAAESVAQVAPAASEPADADGRAVLGRVAVVRREGTDPLARLLAQF